MAVVASRSRADASVAGGLFNASPRDVRVLCLKAVDAMPSSLHSLFLLPPLLPARLISTFKGELTLIRIVYATTAEVES